MNISQNETTNSIPFGNIIIILLLIFNIVSFSSVSFNINAEIFITLEEWREPPIREKRPIVFTVGILTLIVLLALKYLQFIAAAVSDTGELAIVLSEFTDKPGSLINDGVHIAAITGSRT